MRVSREEERLKRRVAQLERKIEVLEYELGELRSIDLIVPIKGMTRTQFRIVQMLARRSPMALPYDALRAAVGLRNDEIIDIKNNVNVHITRARKALKGLGIQILNVRTVGHQMPIESKTKWQALVDAANPKEAAA